MNSSNSSVELALFSVDVILQIDFNVVAHLDVNILAQKATDDGSAHQSMIVALSSAAIRIS